MFRNRADAAHQLARRFKGSELRDPLVLAIPRGGVALGAVLARELEAELDVVLARKLRAPGQSELSISQFYDDFSRVEDSEALDLFGAAAPAHQTT